MKINRIRKLKNKISKLAVLEMKMKIWQKKCLLFTNNKDY